MNFNFRPSKTGFVLVCGRYATAYSHNSNTQGDVKLGKLQDALPMLLGQKGKGTEIGKLANSENFVDQAMLPTYGLTYDTHVFLSLGES